MLIIADSLRRFLKESIFRPFKLKSLILPYIGVKCMCTTIQTAFVQLPFDKHYPIFLPYNGAFLTLFPMLINRCKLLATLYGRLRYTRGTLYWR